ncbi:YqzM family protein [Paenibacillus pasadenensis]|uniref:YqzM family protein n=1 Tax=Paenibacillus pasadenensis TaxID=217090 RepID=UPI00203B1658|nr:YqzM family protein [Paenibacillus pasadenensis]MCM3748178.1 YqzM family protein [Paenibacillus pasadenensis]
MENVNVRDPREHVNEEPRDDLKDLMFGFGGMLGFMTVAYIIMVIVKYMMD